MMVTMLRNRWKPERIRYLFSERNEKGHPNAEPLAATQHAGVVPKSLLDFKTMEAVTSDLGIFKLVEPGDFVISLRSFEGGLEYSAYRGILSPAYTVLRPSANVYAGFFKHLLKSDWFVQGLAKHKKGIRDGQAVPFATLQDDYLGVPPREEQERIANFLDEKTTRIDALISEKEALLVSLNEHQYSYASHLICRGMEPGATLQTTSFPEISEIPKHWSVKRLKFLGEVRSGIAKGKDHGEKDTVHLPYLRMANVQDGYVDLTEVLEIEVGTHEVERFLLKRGDVLMNEGGDNDKLGRGTVWQGQIEPCVHQNHVFAVRLFDTSLAEWVARFTSTDAARTYFFLRSKQSTNLASINQTNVRELPIPMPPEKEREAILDEVRRSASATEQLIAHVREHIDRLREYRSSIISAAVTGQLDINAYQASGEVAVV
ncbi:MAG: type I restriction endonuclease subunit S [Spirochaetes bacterium]|nr:MAG: type I restriction endonuclease subunit S [Spirochaetota bacterium]